MFTQIIKKINKLILIGIKLLTIAFNCFRSIDDTIELTQDTPLESEKTTSKEE